MEQGIAQGTAQHIAKMVSKKLITLAEGRKEAEEEGISAETFDNILRTKYPSFVFPA